MRFSELWLREWINPAIETNELADQLTFLGLEVDTVESAGTGFSNVVVAKIEKLEQHPDADRLRVCQVDDGSGELLQVVCGAPNARTGLMTVLARVGGQLADGTRLKKAKLRGVESNGMLCSAAELGLSEEQSGIWELPDDLTPGTDLAQWLELDDQIIEIDLTPDRGDCLSIRGIARDLSARNDLPLALHEITAAQVKTDKSVPVKVHPDCACVRYSGRVVQNVDLSARTPHWMIERLRRSGIRSINVAVDITNYVMLELGQPMHAFDLEKLQGGIQVRLSVPGERLLLLDGRELVLDDNTTVIADDRGAIGLAGIMGGDSTAVTDRTQHIFFESALFLPERVAGKPRQYASHTDSAHRFERGVDPAGQIEALEYATGLLLNIAGGSAGTVVDWQERERLPDRSQLTVRESRLQRLLGIAPSKQTVNTIFTRLGIQSEPVADGWSVTAPSYRYDLTIEEDYIEEVARVLGYDSIPRTSPTHKPLFSPVPETRVSIQQIRQALVSRGYQEVVSYSFVDDKQQRTLRPDLEALPLANPISSELAVMRTTLLGGLLNTYRHNASRQLESMRLFETGLRFLSNAEAIEPDHLDDFIVASLGDDIQVDSSVQQQQMIAGLIVGRAVPENWNAGSAGVNFYGIKADVEHLLALANAGNAVFSDCQLEMLHPGQRAAIEIDDIPIGYVGALNPLHARKLSIQEPVFVFECALDAFRHAKVPHARELSRYPSMRRDIALLVDESLSFAQLRATVLAAAPASLQSLTLFDIYRGEKVGTGKKSMALGLILQDFSRTLKDKDVERVVDDVVAAARAAHGAELRE